MKILISGYYGSGNTGDEAILSAITDSIRSIYKDAEFTALTFDPVETKKLHGVHSVYRPDFGPKWFSTDFKNMLTTLKNSDLVIIGGGGLLEDAHNYFSIPRYLHTVLLAKLYKKPVMFYSVGIGPIRNGLGKFFVRHICNMCDLITVRDDQSKELLLNIGVTKTRVLVVADPVFVLKPIAPVEAKEILKSEGVPITEKPLIGASVRNVEWTNVQMDEIAKLLDHIASKYNASIVFIPFGYDANPTDLDMSDKVAKKMVEKAYVLRSRYGPREIMGVIGELDVFIGMRLHGIIMSSVMGIPAMGISYLPKVRSILSSLGYSDQYFMDEDVSNLKSADMINTFERILMSKEDIKKFTGDSLKPIQSKAMEPSELIGRISNKNISKTRLIFTSLLFSISIVIFGVLQIYRSRFPH